MIGEIFRRPRVGSVGFTESGEFIPVLVVVFTHTQFIAPVTSKLNMRMVTATLPRSSQAAWSLLYDTYHVLIEWVSHGKKELEIANL